jgi:molybdopterin/thiamine biosynthesis adenylyltransferase
MENTKQVPLRQIGAQAIEKLKNSSVLVVGAGGLGCNVLVHLAGAGIGKLVFAIMIMYLKPTSTDSLFIILTTSAN